MKRGAMLVSLVSVLVCVSVFGADQIGVKRYTNNEKKILKEAQEAQNSADSANNRAQTAEKRVEEANSRISSLNARIQKLEKRNAWLETLVVTYITNGNYQSMLPKPAPPVDEEALAREQEFKQALDTAKNILNAIDAKRYADVYNEAGKSLHNAYTRGRWIGMVSGERTGYGDLVSRNRVADTAVEALAVSGEHQTATLKYVSEFRNANVIETLKLEKMETGEWKLGDYSLK